MADQEPRSYGVGIALLIVGLLILIPSGLCTGVFGGGALLDAIFHPSNAMDSSAMMGMALIFGGPFVLLGGFLVWQGIRRLRGK